MVAAHPGEISRIRRWPPGPAMPCAPGRAAGRTRSRRPAPPLGTSTSVPCSTPPPTRSSKNRPRRTPGLSSTRAPSRSSATSATRASGSSGGASWRVLMPGARGPSVVGAIRHRVEFPLDPPDLPPRDPSDARAATGAALAETGGPLWRDGAHRRAGRRPPASSAPRRDGGDAPRRHRHGCSRTACASRAGCATRSRRSCSG